MTMRADGCYVSSIAMLGQVSPADLLKVKAGFSGGLVVSTALAKACGMTYQGVSKTRPDQTCIAVTDNYKNLGAPTHFFVLLKDGRMLDPLKNPPVPEPLKYKIIEYRLFDNISLAFGQQSDSVLQRLAARLKALGR